MAFNCIRRWPSEIAACLNPDEFEPDDSAHLDPGEPDESANAEKETPISDSRYPNITSDPKQDVPEVWKSRLRPQIG